MSIRSPQAVGGFFIVRYTLYVYRFSSQKLVAETEEYLHTLGPGLTTGAADDDPSGIATYSQAGAQYGFQLLWLALLTFPLMAVVQEMCARIALVSGTGLAANIRTHYSSTVLYVCTGLLFVANTFNLGADLGAMAKATQLLFPSAGFLVLVVFFAMVSLLLQIFTSYAQYASILKYLTMVLFAYVATAFIVSIDWMNVLWHTVIPSVTFSREQLLLICAILGTTISPYLFFWQTGQEIEQEVLEGKTTEYSRRGASWADIRHMREDVWTGMFFSNLVMFFVIATCAATLAAHGVTTIETADQAAQALRPLAGEWAYFLFTLGIVGTGMLAVPVLAGSASYAISESFGWKEGLYRKWWEARAFYGVIVAAMVVGLLLNLIHIDPIRALIYSAVANGLVSPIILVLIVSLSGNKKLMGDKANSLLSASIGWSTVALMAIAGVAALYSLFV